MKNRPTQKCCKSSEDYDLLLNDMEIEKELVGI